MLARIIVLVGLIVLIAGLVLPVACPDSGCRDIPQDALLDYETLQDDTDLGVVSSSFGLMILAAALSVLIGLAAGERGTMLFSSLSIVAVVVLTFLVVQINLNDGFDLSYGWGALAGGALLLLLGSFFMKAARPVGAMMPAATGGMAAAGAGAAFQQATRIDGVPAYNPGGALQKTSIDANFGDRFAPRQQQPAPSPTPMTPPPGNYTPPPRPQQSFTPPPQAPQPAGPYSNPYAQQPAPSPTPMTPPPGNYTPPPGQGLREAGAGEINPNLATQVEMPGMEGGLGDVPSEELGKATDVEMPAYQPPADTRKEARPPANPNLATQVDGIETPESLEIDPYAWKKKMEEEQAAAAKAEAERQAAEAAEAARQAAAEAERKAAEAKAEAERQAAQAQAAVDLDSTNVDVMPGAGAIDSTNQIAAVGEDGRPPNSLEGSTTPLPRPTAQQVNDEMLKTNVDATPVPEDDPSQATAVDMPAYRDPDAGGNQATWIGDDDDFDEGIKDDF